MGSEKLDINFTTISELDCLIFSKKLDLGEIKGSDLKNIVENLKSKKYSEEEAIITIKNIIIVLFDISYDRTDIQTYCGDALLYLTNYIKVEGSENYKILYAEYRSQVEKDEKSLKKNTNKIVLDDIRIRINNFPNVDKEKSLDIKEKIKYLKMKRFFS